MALADYDALEEEESWIDYLRTRLPYSFERMEGPKSSRSQKGNRYFRISEPVLEESTTFSEIHNFWIRGSIFYSAAKLLDFHPIGGLLREYRTNVVSLTLLGQPAAATTRARSFYNSQQAEMALVRSSRNFLDRDRVVMTNVTMASELCLKAVMTHANYRSSKEFTFDAGHDLLDLYDGLPGSLRDELTTESRRFSRDYAEFRSRIESTLKALSDHSILPFLVGQEPAGYREQWEQVRNLTESSEYSAFVGSNDPTFALDNLPQDWLGEALAEFRKLRTEGDAYQYYRYGPSGGEDSLSTRPIDLGLLFGRFLYEHLFPVRVDWQTAQPTPFIGQP